ncbi:hypothetical protein PBCV1_a573L [Paramecium bursaria Chlorella virus 1]|uniref:Uncharacterized protein n=1 Tax=Paramecium bursaria Chlorella virus 1 TaxID=10506 RepID=O41055_PBCV1|nr:hypothetical protein PBCV1_a573L [Paramecium bursaria Chlorella virus 1]AAC97005.1 hypothetical protein [Paramecium bursaria Chlorella virus 1]
MGPRSSIPVHLLQFSRTFSTHLSIHRSVNSLQGILHEFRVQVRDILIYSEIVHLLRFQDHLSVQSLLRQ